MRVGWTTDTVTNDARRALHYTLLWGLEGVVLRTIGAAGDRVPFINEAPLRKRVESHGLPIFAIDPGVFEGAVASRASWMNEIDTFANIASFCHRLDVPIVLAGSLSSGGDSYNKVEAANAIRQLGEVASQANLRLAIRNENGTSVATGTALASLLKDVGHPAIQADWRPNDALRAGEDPAVGLDALWGAAEIACVTVQDTTSDGTPAVPGQGQVDWDGLLRTLALNEWDGLVALEIHGRPTGAFGLHTSSAMISAVRRAKRSAGA